MRVACCRPWINFTGSGREHVDVGRPGQCFVPDGLDVVPDIAELVGPTVAEVLVELEPHVTST